MFVEPAQLITLFIFLFAATLVASVMSILNAHRADKLEDDVAQLKKELPETTNRIWDAIEKIQEET